MGPRKIYSLSDIPHLAYKFLLVSMVLACGAWALWDVVTDFANKWFWLPLAVLYSSIINEQFCHRIVSHRLYEIDTRSWTYKFMTWMASADMAYGPVWKMTLWHHAHHKYSDQSPADNMNWRYHWYSSTAVLPFPQLTDPTPPQVEKYVKKQLDRHPVLKDPWTIFCHNHNLLISTVTNVFFYLILPVFFFYVVALGRLMCSVITMLGATCGHTKNFPLSYRNFDTKDSTSNPILLHYLFLGLYAGLLENNHHGRPRSIRPHPRWWEIDTAWPFLFILKKLTAKTV